MYTFIYLTPILSLHFEFAYNIPVHTKPVYCNIPVHTMSICILYSPFNLLYFLLSVFLSCHCHSVALWKLLSRNKFLVCVNIPGNKAHSDPKFEVDITTIVVPVRFSLGTIPKIATGLHPNSIDFFMQFSVTNQSFSVTISLLLQNSYQIWSLDCQTFPTICVVKITKRSEFLKQKPQNHRVIYIYIYISWFIGLPLKGRRIPWDTNI